MTQPAKAKEPSMEEILASIRRIIADDDAAKTPPKAAAPLPSPLPAAAPPPPMPTLAAQVDVDAMLAELAAVPDPPPQPAPQPPMPERPDVLDLTEAMAAPMTPPGEGFRTIDGQSDIMFGDDPDEAAPPPFNPISPSALMSATTSAVVDSAFNSLAQTVLVHNARTLEDLVREMLRPMLKTWLDDNLPGLVERLVRAEIERVARGRG